MHRVSLSPLLFVGAASVRPPYVLCDELLGAGHMTTADASEVNAGWRCDQTGRGSCWSLPDTRCLTASCPVLAVRPDTCAPRD